MPADLYLALGSNIAPRRHLAQALRLLRARYPLLRVSSWFHTLPWGETRQPWFLNCAVHVVTREEPLQVLDFTQAVERLLGRRRVLPNGPRTVDIDLLLYGDHVHEDARLMLPHPGLRARDFMLVPLLELAPRARDPRDGTRLAAALSAVTWRQIVRRARPARSAGAPIRQDAGVQHPLARRALAARGETPAAFERRCIPAGGVARRSHIPGYARSSRLASRAPRRSRCHAGFHHGLLGGKARV